MGSDPGDDDDAEEQANRAIAASAIGTRRRNKARLPCGVARAAVEGEAVTRVSWLPVSRSQWRHRVGFAPTSRLVGASGSVSPPRAPRKTELNRAGIVKIIHTMPTLPSLESLRCFCAAARLPSFRAAARSVALTPAAFGQRVRALEEELGEVLFLRTTRSVRLSVAGLHLLPVAERAIAAAEDCARAVKATREMPAMSVVLGTRHELGISWILPQIDALVAAHPFLDLHLYFGSGSDLVNRVRSAEIDCAVTSTPLADPKIDAIRLHREEYVFVGAPQLLRESPLRAPKDASRHTLVDIDDRLPLFRYWREAPKGHPLAFASLARFGTIEAIRRRVLAGAGVAVLPRYLVAPDLAQRRLAVVLPKVEAQSDWFRLIFRADDPRRSAYDLLTRSMAASPLR